MSAACGFCLTLQHHQHCLMLCLPHCAQSGSSWMPPSVRAHKEAWGLRVDSHEKDSNVNRKCPIRNPFLGQAQKLLWLKKGCRRENPWCLFLLNAVISCLSGTQREVSIWFAAILQSSPDPRASLHSKALLQLEGIPVLLNRLFQTISMDYLPQS